MADIFTFHVYDDRTIQYTLAEPIMLEDSNVTAFHFRIPKVLNGIDMTGWSWWFVYENASAEKYSVPLLLADDTDDPDNYSLAVYTVDTGMSGKAGRIRFALEVIDADSTTGEILHEWHTRTYTTNVVSTLQGNEREFTPSEYDLISAKLEEIMEMIEGGGSSTVDSELSTASENPVQNKAIAQAVSALNDQLANIEENTQEIGTLTIKNSDGTSLGTYNGSANTQITLPASSGGSTVTVTQTLTSGTEIGSITVDDTTTKLYAPEGGSSGGGLRTWSEVLNIDFSTYEMPTNRHIVLSALPSYTKFVLTTFTPVSDSTSDSRAMMSLNGVGYASNTIFPIYKSGTTSYITNTIIEYDGRYWWISQNSDRVTNSANTDGSYKLWKRWGSPIVTGPCTSLDFYFLVAPLSGQMVLYGGK